MGVSTAISIGFAVLLAPALLPATTFYSTTCALSRTTAMTENFAGLLTREAAYLVLASRTNSSLSISSGYFCLTAIPAKHYQAVCRPFVSTTFLFSTRPKQRLTLQTCFQKRGAASCGFSTTGFGGTNGAGASTGLTFQAA